MCWRGGGRGGDWKVKGERLEVGRKEGGADLTKYSSNFNERVEFRNEWGKIIFEFGQFYLLCWL